MLKVDWKTECMGIERRIELFERDVQRLNLPDLTGD